MILKRSTVKHFICISLAGAGLIALLNLINFTVEIKATHTHKLCLRCFLSEQYPFIFRWVSNYTTNPINMESQHK